MPRSRASFAAVLFVGALAASDPLLSQATPFGKEFQVNVYTVAGQANPTVATEGDGDFVVAWASFTQDGSGLGVFARRFNASGVALGAELQVNSYTSGGQGYPAVAIDSDGDFVVAWFDLGHDGSDSGVFARRFGSSGVGLGSEFQVNTFTLFAQAFPAVGMDGNGNFVVAWSSSSQDGQDSSLGVFARRFNASGVGLGSEFQVNTYTSGAQAYPAVGLDGNGDFVIAWMSIGQDDGLNSGVFARRFASSGFGQGVEFQVNTYTPYSQSFPAVDTDDGGDFVVAWSSSVQDGGPSVSVFARRFSASGVGLGSEFQVNAYTPGPQAYPAVSMADDGEFVVSWWSDGQDGSGYGVFARSFSASGAGRGPEFQVNAYHTGNQQTPAVSLGGGGRFVIAWHSLDQDGDSAGVFAQRYATFAVLDIDANGATGALTDGLLVLRFLFGFTGPTLVTGAVDVAGCTRCSAPVIEAYLQTLI